MTLRREFNAISKLRHYLQVLAFTLVVATLQYYDARIRREGFDLQMLVAKLERGQ